MKKYLEFKVGGGGGGGGGAEHSTGIPDVIGPMPVLVKHIFQLIPVWIYIHSNISNMS